MSRLQSPSLHLLAKNDLAEIGRIAAVIDKFCADRGLGDETAHAVNLVLDELLTNTISYGYADAAGHVIDIALTLSRESLTVTIRDDAVAFDPTTAATPDLDAEIDERPIGGLGIHFVRTIMDKIEYRRVSGYNELTLTKFLKS